MDVNEENEDKKLVVTLMAYRSPTFSLEEITKLVDLVEKYKSVLLNKSINNSAKRIKQMTWLRIVKAFNNSNFKHERNADNLRTKWENLKKDARKVSKNVISMSECKESEYSDIIARIVGILNDHNVNITNEFPMDSDEDFSNRSSNQESCRGSPVDNQLDGLIDVNKNARDRSVNFTTRETKLLLQCVREEKDIVYLKSCSGSTKKLKNSAWIRIANSYNAKSAVKRPVRVLRTKFINMKRLAKTTSFKNYIKDFGRKREKLVNENNMEIKTESEFDKLDFKLASHDNGLNDMHIAGDNHEEIDSPEVDPLRTVLNSKDGSSWSCKKNKELVRLKGELLNYQLETAKLERQRVKDAMLAEASDQEVRAIEAALRLRTARLLAVTAETKLPPSHPALAYTPAEAKAQQYMNSIQYQT